MSDDPTVQSEAEANPLQGRLESYDVGERIGRGGTANVFIARHLDGHPVAIKLVRPEVARVLGVGRFLREIQIAASVADPHLLPLEAWGEVDGLPYYVMPYAAGGSLRDRLVREKQLQLPEAIRLGRELAEALAALHGAGIVHRDVKPENVLLESDGRVRLADYGIARAVTLAAMEPLTSTGIVLGTPAYMSPEQGAGDPVDGRTDIYAWGCVLYELLAGEPPFGGITAQAIIRRHVNDPPPTLRSARPDLPAGVDALIQRTLAKSPADRVESAAQLLEAIDRLDLDAPPAPSTGGAMGLERARRRKRWAAAILVPAAVVAGWLLSRDTWVLDPNRVVVYPFASTDTMATGEGEQLALLIGSALERSEPIKWLDGWPMLDAALRRDPRGLSPTRARSLAGRTGARYFLTGSILHFGDSVRVMTLLHDVRDAGNSVGRSATGPRSTALVQLALEAVVGLLPNLAGVGQSTDLANLRGRKPTALIKWLKGERDYRASLMESALDLFEAAVADDSLLAPAALRGAMAASWISSNRADSLIALARRHEIGLSPRQRLLAPAVEAFIGGRANDAIRALRRLMAVDSSWVEAWMLAGEVQIHLLPTVALDSLALDVVPRPPVQPLEQWARDDFARALKLDSTFLPPVPHLVEIALRQRNIAEATRFLDLLRRSGSPATTVRRLDLGLRCVRDGADRVDWRVEARRDARTAAEIAATLMASQDRGVRACALSAFQAILATDTAYASEDWASLVGLQGLLVAEGRSADAIAQVDSAVKGGLSAALGLFVLDEVAGVPVGDRGKRFIAQLGEDYSVRGSQSLWLLTIWHAAQGHREAVERIARVLADRARSSGDRLDRLMAVVSAAYALLARGDSAEATKRFLALEPTAKRDDVGGSLWESLAAERIVLARLLQAQRQWALAHRVAASFDHPVVFVHPLFLRQSLVLREQAAESLGNRSLALAARRRLGLLAAAERSGAIH